MILPIHDLSLSLCDPKPRKITTVKRAQKSVTFSFGSQDDAKMLLKRIPDEAQCVLHVQCVDD